MPTGINVVCNACRLEEYAPLEDNVINKSEKLLASDTGNALLLHGFGNEGLSREHIFILSQWTVEAMRLLPNKSQEIIGFPLRSLLSFSPG